MILKFLKKLISLDMFGKPVELTIDEFSNQKTLLGAIITVSMSALFVTYLIT